MNLKKLIHETASRADKILEGCSDSDEAHSIIATLLASENRSLQPADAKIIASEVIAILNGEGFFESIPGSGSEWEDDDSDDSLDDNE